MSTKRKEIGKDKPNKAQDPKEKRATNDLTRSFQRALRTGRDNEEENWNQKNINRTDEPSMKKLWD